MKPVLVKKAYLPTIDEARGVSLDDIQALRWIPGKYRSSFSQATPFRTLGNIKWEKDKEKDLGEAYRPIPGFREGTNFQGYFMNPATAYGALQGDVGWNYPANRAVNPILLGITNTPHFWRTPKQGASMQGYAGEGYHYGTLPKASFVEIPHETSPVDMQRAMMDFQRNRVLQGMSSDEAWDTMAEKNPDAYDVAGLFPRKITETIWGEPAQLAGNPIVDFDTSRYKVASEPMDIAFQLLKERVSPEAKRHKLEYDKKYESTPERVKYREELNRERRRRGIYGSHNHKDISHTEGGKLTLEGEHENRARHFKDKGTLREL